MLTCLFHEDFPDPSGFIDDEWIYLYGTRGYNAQYKNLQIRRAKTWAGPWEDMGGALKGTPSWGIESSEFWAPHAPVRVGDEYRLYYVTNPDHAVNKGLAIAMARSGTPYDFIPAEKYVHSGRGYCVIDPFVLSYEGSEWLFWGSHHEPIKCRRLAADGCGFEPHTRTRSILYPTLRQYENLVEGFFMAYHEELRMWFAFVSGSDTWDKHNYGVTAYRSPHPFGPFERLGTLIAPSRKWWAPGQNSIIIRNGEWFFLCHAACPTSAWLPGTNRRRLKRVPCVARVSFPEGLPTIIPLD